MLGRLVGGCEESPSKGILFSYPYQLSIEMENQSKFIEEWLVMELMFQNLKEWDLKFHFFVTYQEPSNKSYTPEGVEGYIPYAGPL